MSEEKYTDEEYGELIVQPIRDGQFKSSEYATLQQVREAFLERGFELPQFTAGLKYLLDNEILKRVTDNKLRLRDNP